MAAIPEHGFELPEFALPDPFADDAHYLAWEFRRIEILLEASRELLEAADPGAAFGDLALFSQGLREDVVYIRERSRPLAFYDIVDRYGLEPEEEEILLLALAQGMSEQLRGMLLEFSATRDAITVGFASELVRPSLDSKRTDVRWTQPGRNLIRYGLVEITPPMGGPHAVLLDWRVRAPEWLVMAAQSYAAIDPRWGHLAKLEMVRRGLEDIVLPDHIVEQLNTFLESFAGADRRPVFPDENWVLTVGGPRRSGKTLLIDVIASAFGRPVFRIDVGRLSREPDPAHTLHLMLHNAAFYQSVVHVQQPECIKNEHHLFGPLIDEIEGYPGLVVLETRKADDLDPAFDAIVTHSLGLPRPELEERIALWELHMPRDVEVSDDLRLPDLGSAYDLVGGQVSRATQWAMRRAAAGGPKRVELAQKDLVDGARNQLFSRLGRYADRRQVKATLEDLILADEIMEQVESVLNAAEHRHRVMNDWGFGSKLNRGRGLVCLFSGEPGTGKTLCAEILANQLGLQLDIVSIPKIVSKWVGETERNIQQIFAEAKASDTVLLFDEADSLFAKRVKVERAQDHFQNMEVNMLLQEIERFDGIVLLTTNLEVNMDKAFQRRILYKIEFPMPEEEQRTRIWQALLPKQLPLSDDVDFEGLGERFELSGGQIKNAIVLAAYESFPNPVDHMALADAAMVQARAAGMLAQQPAPWDEFS